MYAEGLAAEGHGTELDEETSHDPADEIAHRTVDTGQGEINLTSMIDELRQLRAEGQGGDGV